MGAPPYLPAVPRLALAFREAADEHHRFLDIPDGMRAAVAMLMTLNAAVDCLIEPGLGGRKVGAAPLVPELWEARGACVRLIEVLRESGIPLSAVEYRLTPEEKADLRRQVAAVHARVEAPAAPVRKKAGFGVEASARSAKQKPAAAAAPIAAPAVEVVEAQAVEEPPAAESTYAPWLL
jgi:hypothetical protein